MNRTLLKFLWVFGTFVLISVTTNSIPQNAGEKVPTLGLMMIVEIVVSVLVFKKVAGPKFSRFERTQWNRYPTIENFHSKQETSNPIQQRETVVSHESYEQYKGRLGEDKVANQLASLTFPNRILKNLLIEENGMTHEVDLIFINPCGVYVIESKNYGGWIFGNADHHNWTQTFANQTKNQFYNPIKQNEGHLKIVRSKLRKFGEVELFSVIVFSDDAVLKSVPRSENRTLILNLSELTDMMTASVEFNTKLSRGSALPLTTIDSIWDELYQYSLATSQEKEAHIQNVASFVRSK